jgi:hypothetical protein
MVWIRFRTWILNRCRNRTVTKVGTGTAINRYGSTTLQFCHQFSFCKKQKDAKASAKRNLSAKFPVGKSECLHKAVLRILVRSIRIFFSSRNPKMILISGSAPGLTRYMLSLDGAMFTVQPDTTSMLYTSIEHFQNYQV